MTAKYERGGDDAGETEANATTRNERGSAQRMFPDWPREAGDDLGLQQWLSI